VGRDRIVIRHSIPLRDHPFLSGRYRLRRDSARGICGQENFARPCDQDLSPLESNRLGEACHPSLSALVVKRLEQGAALASAGPFEIGVPSTWLTGPRHSQATRPNALREEEVGHERFPVERSSRS
ncbi:MAG: hypothetical protein ACREA0_07365, partial [bacterium]